MACVVGWWGGVGWGGVGWGACGRSRGVCGVVWYDVVWCGVVWCGVVWWFGRLCVASGRCWSSVPLMWHISYTPAILVTGQIPVSVNLFFDLKSKPFVSCLAMTCVPIDCV